MRTKRTYIAPMSKFVSAGTGVILQTEVIPYFSGGDIRDTHIVIDDEDDSEGSNRIIRWTNHLWDEY